MARYLAGTGCPPTRQHQRLAIDLLNLDLRERQLRFERRQVESSRIQTVRQPHNRNMIMGSNYLQDHEQRDQQQRDDREQRALEKERVKAGSRIKVYSEKSCFILTMCCLSALSMVSHDHMTASTEDPCPYLAHLCPWRVLYVSDWLSYFGLGTLEQAKCVVAMIWVALSLLAYVAITRCLPPHANYIICGIILAYSSLILLLQDTANKIVGIVLVLLFVPTGLAHLWGVTSLHDELDDYCNSSIELKRARKYFEKMVRGIWTFQILCLVLTGSFFVALGSSSQSQVKQIE